MTKNHMHITHLMRNTRPPGFLFAFVLFIFAFLIPNPTFLSAATISIVPSSASGSYSIGQVFAVPILVSTVSGDPLNAVSGVISFPANILQVVSIDKSGSIIDFWINNPSFSNAEGTVSFEGGSYNPGFSGSGGKVASVLFRAKATGSATISFLSSSILANDGRGTNILDKANPTTITVTAQAAPVNIPNPNASSLVIRSATHPDQNAWYSFGEVVLNWTLPLGVTSVRTDVDHDPSGSPAKISSPAVAETSLTLGDGTWYFHLQTRDDNGWSPISTYKIQVDTARVAPPVFDRFAMLLNDGESLLISGTAPANAQISIFLKGGSGKESSQTTHAGADGRFQMVWSERLPVDTYDLSAEAINSHGQKSIRTESRVVTVQAGAITRIGGPVLTYATLFVMIVGSIFLCILWTWYLVHHFRRFRKKVRADVRRTSQLIHVEFKKLLDQAHAKRKLTSEEERMMSLIREHIHEAEDEVEKDVGEIGK